MKRKTLLFLMIISGSLFNSLWAHPHMFIDQSVVFEFDGPNLKGFRVTWHMDPMFTTMILVDYDLDNSDSFDKEEVKDIEENAFSNLVNYGYYIHLYENEEKITITEVSEFSAWIEDERLVYQFFVPLPRSSRADFHLAIYDTAFFCDLAYVKTRPISLKNDDRVTCRYSREENDNFAIAYDNSVIKSTREDANYTGFVIPEFIDFSFEGFYE